MISKNLKLIGSGFVYGLVHPFDNELVGRPSEDQTIAEAMLDGAAAGLGQGITQGVIALAITTAMLVGIGIIDSKLKNAPVKVKMVVDPTPKKK